MSSRFFFLQMNVCLLKSIQVNTDKEMDARQMMRDKHDLIRFLLFFFVHS
jgi:hypothetical protein